MRRRKFLCWRCGCPGRLHVLCRICIYILVICRMRHDFFDLRHDGLQRWVRLCRRLVAARPMHVQCWIREYTDGAVILRNECGALQPVRSGHLLLGQCRATGGVRHRLGSRRQLLSCWYDDRIGHDVPCWQLLRWRGGERRYAVPACVRPLTVFSGVCRW